MPLVDEIRNRLAVLQPEALIIQDNSAAHAGHNGNAGGGHFTLKITSSHFRGKSPIMRHRIVYQALGDLLPQRIHAVSIEAMAPAE